MQFLALWVQAKESFHHFAHSYGANTRNDFMIKKKSGIRAE
jgi:hypothetical protein